MSATSALKRSEFTICDDQDCALIRGDSLDTANHLLGRRTSKDVPGNTGTEQALPYESHGTRFMT